MDPLTAGWEPGDRIPRACHSSGVPDHGNSLKGPVRGPGNPLLGGMPLLCASVRSGMGIRNG